MSLGAIITIGFAMWLQPIARQDIPCYYERPASTVTESLWDGFVVTVGLAEDAKDNPEEACRIEVRDGAGRSVFSSSGFNTILHSATGRDIDNDGKPDAVLGTDTGGGNRCCFEYAVFSFSPAPHVVATLSPAAFTADANGKTLIWTTEAFYDLGGSMAESPTVERVQQFRAGKLVEVTAEYCTAMLSGKLQGPGDLTAELSALSAAAKQRSREAKGEAADHNEIHGAALTIALQSLYCNQVEAASRLIEEVWPPSERSLIRSTLRVVIGQWPNLKINGF